MRQVPHQPRQRPDAEVALRPVREVRRARSRTGAGRVERMERESQNRKLTTDVSGSTARVSSLTTVVVETRASRRIVSRASRRVVSFALVLVCLAVFTFPPLRGSNPHATPASTHGAAG